jgi:hypothetical protein
MSRFFKLFVKSLYRRSEQVCDVYPVSAKKTPIPKKSLLSLITPHPNLNVGDRMLQMQRTEMKKPIF